MADFLLQDLKAIQRNLDAFGNQFVALIPIDSSNVDSTETLPGFTVITEPIADDNVREINAACINGLCLQIEKTHGLGSSYVAFFRKRAEKTLAEGRPLSGRDLSKLVGDLIDAKEWENKNAGAIYSKFHIEAERPSQGMVIVRVSGRLDAATVDVFEKNALPLAQDASIDRFILSCDDLQYVASTGIRILVGIIKALALRKAKFYASGLRPDMYLILKTTGLQKFMVVKESVEECISDTGS